MTLLQSFALLNGVGFALTFIMDMKTQNVGRPFRITKRFIPIVIFGAFGILAYMLLQWTIDSIFKSMGVGK